MECSVSDCDQPSAAHVTEVESRRCVREQSFCHLHAERYFTQFHRTKPVIEGTCRAIESATAFDLELIVYRIDGHTGEVFLREVGGIRRFGLACGLYEATTISCLLRTPSPPRPLTHDTIVNVISAFGGRLQHVVIHDHVQEGNFYLAKLCVVQGDRVVEVDVRPSDAIGTAIRSDVPIYVVDRLVPIVSLQFRSHAQASDDFAERGVMVKTCQDENAVIFSGKHTYRKPGSLKRILISAALGGIACCVAGLGPVMSPDNLAIAFAMGPLLVFGLVVLGFAIHSSWRWGINRVEHFEISKRGIRYGPEHWAWDSLAVVRITLLNPKSGCWAMHLRTHKDRRLLYPILVDGSMTAEQRDRLVSRIARFCENSGFNVVCEWGDSRDTNRYWHTG